MYGGINRVASIINTALNDSNGGNASM